MSHNACCLYACSYEIQTSNADVSQYSTEWPLQMPSRLDPLVTSGKCCNEKLT